MNDKAETFADSFQKNNDTEYLSKRFRNVYFIIGTAYAGKSTVLKMLTEHYNGILSNLKNARVHWVIEISNVVCQCSVAFATVILLCRI